MNDTMNDDESYPVGPTHYEGWTCDNCKWLTQTTHFYCFEPNIQSSNIDNEITDRQHTPNWCPYLKYAMMEHVVSGN